MARDEEQDTLEHSKTKEEVDKDEFEEIESLAGIPLLQHLSLFLDDLIPSTV